MDRKIMALIDEALAELPEMIPHCRYRQYEQAKALLQPAFPESAAYQYLCQAAARKYEI